MNCEYRDVVFNHTRQALSEDNAREFDGGPNFKKCLVISTCVTGPLPSANCEGGFAFEAKIPRNAYNELGLSISWGGDGSISRTEAAAFLRDLANLIECPEDEGAQWCPDCKRLAEEDGDILPPACAAHGGPPERNAP